MKRKEKIARELNRNLHSQGHVEIILSFVIFIGFLALLFIFFNPISPPRTSSVAIDDVQEKILDYVSIDYDYGSVILKIIPSESCFSVANSIGLAGNEGLIVLDANNTIVNSRYSSQKIYIQKSSSSTNKFYRFYVTPDSRDAEKSFNTYSFGDDIACTDLAAADYNFGAVSRDSMPLYENLEALNYNYESTYSELKKILSPAYDFEFVVYNLNRAVIMNNSLGMHNIKSSNVFSRELLLKTINRDAKQDDIILGLRVW